MTDCCDITVLLDRSGSMLGIKHTMESGFDEFLSKHRETPTTRLSLIQFDDQNPYDVVYLERPITDAPKLDLDPRGMTPLRDALCQAIDETGRRLRDKREGDRPNKVLFLVITDGMENASRQYTYKDVRKRVKQQTDTYRWEFVYLGANQDAIVEAGKLGMDLTKAITYDVNKTSTAWRGLATNTACYASINGSPSAAQADVALNWTNAQREEVIDNKATNGTTSSR